MTVQILHGDCRDILKTLPDQSVHCCVTSPPYFGLRDYGVDGQIGLEQTPHLFVKEMVAVFYEVKRILRDDGTLWLNLGDSYSAGGRGNNTEKQKSNKGTGIGSVAEPWKVPGFMPKQLLGIPWRVAFALQDHGWYLRQDIIWHKPNPMPESVRDRCTKAHEYIFMLSKSQRYYFDQKAIAEDAVEGGVRISSAYGNAGTGKPSTTPYTRGTKPRFGGAKYGDSDDPKFATYSGNEYQENGSRNKRSVWTVASQPFTGAHFATFPPDLIEPCIKAGCPAGGTVLDPFGGSGTTGLVADRFNRNAILIELNIDYVAMAHERILADAGMFAEVGT